MTTPTLLPALIERFFTQRLVHQSNVSPHTLASYQDTFRLLFRFAQATLYVAPSNLALTDLEPTAQPASRRATSAASLGFARCFEC